MPEAYIYDHVRTPRGRGKADGALHEVTALALATVPLKALKERNNIAADVIDDVVLGVVDPVGEAGSDIARFAAIQAGLGESVPGVQISRFCASGLDAVNFAAAQIMSGQHELTIGGGAESMSRVGIGASGGAWPMDPSIAVPAYFMPQGVSADLIATKYGFSRDDVDAYAVQSQQRAAKAWDEGRFKNSVVPVKDVNGLTILAKDEHMRPSTTMQSLGQLQPSFASVGQMGGFDAVAIQSHPEIERVNYVHHAGNSSGIVDGAGAVLLGSKEAGAKHGLKPRAKIRAFANIGSEPAMMLTGPVDVTQKAVRALGHEEIGHRPVRIERGIRLGGAALHPGLRHRQRQDQRQWRRDRARPSARRHRRDDFGHRARRTRAHQQVDRPCHAVHRRRHGHRDDHREESASLRGEGGATSVLRLPTFPAGGGELSTRQRASCCRIGSDHMAYKNFKIETDADGIALVTWDTPGRSMNVLDETSINELEAIVKQTSADAAVKGVVITSGKEALCAGADLSMLEGMSRSYAEALKDKGDVAANQMLFDQSRRFSQVFRGIETSGKPWVAAINGLALGGGFELTLSCHYRVAAENPKTRVGLPEVKVGLFPGAGGTQRVPRIVPPQDAMQLLLKGEAINLDKAKALKLVDAVVPAADMIKTAKDWIKGGGKAVAPWDEKGFKLPGGPVYSKAGMMMFPAGNAIFRRETYDNYPAARAIMQCVYEGLQLPIDAALAGRVALLHADPAQQGSGGDDPQPVPVDAGIEQGRPPPAKRAADQSQEARRDRRRLHGRQRRLCLGARRHRGGADRPRPGKRRQGQGAMRNR